MIGPLRARIEPHPDGGHSVWLSGVELRRWADAAEGLKAAIDTLLQAQMDRRTSELLEANNREVARRRTAEDALEAAIRALLADLYTDAEAEQWLQSHHPLLGNRTPRGLIHDGKGAEVVRLLVQLREGAYT